MLKIYLYFSDSKRNFQHLITFYDNEKFNVKFVEYDSDNIRTSSLSFGFLELKLGKQFLVRPLSNDTSFTRISSFFLVHDDEIRAEYRLNLPDSLNNFIEFTEINKEQGILRGIFRGVYVLNSSIPDTIRITDGVFDLRTEL